MTKWNLVLGKGSNFWRLDGALFICAKEGAKIFRVGKATAITLETSPDPFEGWQIKATPRNNYDDDYGYVLLSFSE